MTIDFRDKSYMKFKNGALEGALTPEYFGKITQGAVSCKFFLTRCIDGKYGVKGNVYILGDDSEGTKARMINKKGIPYCYVGNFTGPFIKDTYEDTCAEAFAQFAKVVRNNLRLGRGLHETENTWEKIGA